MKFAFTNSSYSGEGKSIPIPVVSTPFTKHLVCLTTVPSNVDFSSLIVKVSFTVAPIGGGSLLGIRTPCAEISIVPIS